MWFVAEEVPYVFDSGEEINHFVARALDPAFGPGAEGVLEYLRDHPNALPGPLEPRDPEPLMGGTFHFVRKHLPPAQITRLVVRLSNSRHDHVGFAYLYVPSLKGAVLDLVARGDPAMFERMSELLEPGRRAAAILFADLEASSALSRRLSTAAFFSLIRDLTTALDEAVNDHGGIPGKHAGDGVTALFLADQLGGASAGARSAISAARAMKAAVSMLDAGGSAPALNVGLHWGPTLYVGQLVTGGRLEVTALGDPMNEAARIEQSARGGAVLASKDLLEQLEPSDAAALDVAPEAVSYTLLAELDGASEKARRDAGTLPVAPL